MSRPWASTHGSAIELLDAIAGLREREDMTIVLTTHYLDEAERLCDRVAIIHARRDRRARHARRRCWPASAPSCSSCASHGDLSVALAALARTGIAADDAFVVGATLTVPLHDATRGRRDRRDRTERG